MPVTKPSRLQIIAQLSKANPDPAFKIQLEQWLDDANPVGQQFESMFAARSEMSRAMNDVQTKEAKLAQERAGLAAWKQTNEAQLAAMEQDRQRKISEAATMAKIAVDKINAAKAKAQLGETLTFDDLSVDSSLAAFAAASSGTQGGGNFNSQQQQPSSQQFQQQSNPNFNQPSQQPSGAVSAEDFAKSLIKDIAGLERIKFDHFKLYGEFPDVASLVELAQDQGRSLAEVYTETYNPEAKRAEVAQREFDAKVEAAVQEKVKAALASTDPSGQASSLATFGMGENKNPSAALKYSGPDQIAANLDPLFASRMGMANQMNQFQQQQTQLGPSGTTPSIPPKAASLSDMDAFLADFNEGLRTNRTSNDGTAIIK